MQKKKKGLQMHESALKKITSQKIEKFSCAKIPQPLYSPDLAGSDYHLFSRLHLKGLTFRNHDVKTNFSDFFSSKSKGLFY